MACAVMMVVGTKSAMYLRPLCVCQARLRGKTRDAHKEAHSIFGDRRGGAHERHRPEGSFRKNETLAVTKIFRPKPSLHLS